MLVVMHILALHETGSNNPDGIEIKENKGADGIPVDGIAFHPYYTSKDLVAIIVFLILFSGVVFFARWGCVALRFGACFGVFSIFVSVVSCCGYQYRACVVRCVGFGAFFCFFFTFASLLKTDGGSAHWLSGVRVSACD